MLAYEPDKACSPEETIVLGLCAILRVRTVAPEGLYLLDNNLIKSHYSNGSVAYALAY